MIRLSCEGGFDPGPFVHYSTNGPLVSVKSAVLKLKLALGPQQNQGKGFYREAGFTECSCDCTLPPDQEEASAWQRQSGPGAEIDSCSCLGMGLTGTGSGVCWAETVQRGSREIFVVLLGNG